MTELEVLTLEEVAELLRVHTQTAKKLLETGELRGRKVGRQWRVTRAEVERYLAGEDRFSPTVTAPAMAAAIAA